jgi:general secretion pathway protein G
MELVRMPAVTAVPAPRARRLVSRRGVTLIELMVVLGILAILAMMVNHVAEIMATREREQQLDSALRALRGAIDAHKRAFDAGRIKREAGASGYPKDLQTLVDGVEDQLDPQHGKLKFLDRIPPDPMERNTALAPAATWATRAYASPPEAPVSGSDVYDVHSRSQRPGLNGAYYSKW